MDDEVPPSDQQVGPHNSPELTPVSEAAMHAVVNHMKLSEPLDDGIIARMNSELMSSIGKMPGVVHGLCVQVADDGIVVVVVCESAESLERVHQEVGLPWVRENLKPYLASTDRKVGAVIARAVVTA
jgi:hypothetical protein